MCVCGGGTGRGGGAIFLSSNCNCILMNRENYSVGINNFTFKLQSLLQSRMLLICQELHISLGEVGSKVQKNHQNSWQKTEAKRAQDSDKLDKYLNSNPLFTIMFSVLEKQAHAA